MTVGLTIRDIREALASQLKTNIEKQCTVDAWPTGTAATSQRITVNYATGDTIDYWVTFGAAGLSVLRLELIVEPGGSDAKTASQRLDEFLSVGTGNRWSVVDAVMADRTLGLGAGISTYIDSVAVDEQLVARFGVSVHVSKQGAEV